MVAIAVLAVAFWAAVTIAAIVTQRYASGQVSGYTWDHSDVHGLSIYYSTSKSSSAFGAFVGPSLYQMGRDGTWDEFLVWALPTVNRRGMFSSRSQNKYGDDTDASAFNPIHLPLVIKRHP